MRHLGTWVSDGLGSAGLPAGLSDLKCYSSVSDYMILGCLTSSLWSSAASFGGYVSPLPNPPAYWGAFKYPGVSTIMGIFIFCSWVPPRESWAPRLYLQSVFSTDSFVLWLDSHPSSTTSCRSKGEVKAKQLQQDLPWSYQVFSSHEKTKKLVKFWVKSSGLLMLLDIITIFFYGADNSSAYYWVWLFCWFFFFSLLLNCSKTALSKVLGRWPVGGLVGGLFMSDLQPLAVTVSAALVWLGAELQTWSCSWCSAHLQSHWLHFTCATPQISCVWTLSRVRTSLTALSVCFSQARKNV